MQKRKRGRLGWASIAPCAKSAWKSQHYIVCQKCSCISAAEDALRFCLRLVAISLKECCSDFRTCPLEPHQPSDMRVLWIYTNLPPSPSHKRRNFQLAIQSSLRISSLSESIYIHSGQGGGQRPEQVWHPNCRVWVWQQGYPSKSSPLHLHPQGEDWVTRSSIMLDVQEVPKTFWRVYLAVLPKFCFSVNTPFFWKFS